MPDNAPQAQGGIIAPGDRTLSIRREGDGVDARSVPLQTMQRLATAPQKKYACGAY
jgi:hypothetical protein